MIHRRLAFERSAPLTALLLIGGLILLAAAFVARPSSPSVSAALRAPISVRDSTPFVNIPHHSVGWNDLSRPVQKKITARLQTGPIGPRGLQGEPGPSGPAGRDAPTPSRETPEPPGASSYPPPRCEFVQGECAIYSVDFWRLQLDLEEFEDSPGVYPEPPFCMKAAAEAPAGDPVVCPQVGSYLYPDGTLGDEPWILDSSEPRGWRLYADAPSS
jgi:hypothetical protein